MSTSPLPVGPAPSAHGPGGQATATRTISTPVGPVLLVAGPAGLRGVTLPGPVAPVRPDAAEGPPGRQHATASGSRPDDPQRALVHLERAVVELGEYFAGQRRAFTLALDPRGTAFQRRAWEVLATIPFGETLSYGAQASALGGARLARAAGAANGRNPLPIVVPCHRVIAADGTIGGYAGGVRVKEWLLAHERHVARSQAAGRSA